MYIVYCDDIYEVSCSAVIRAPTTQTHTATRSLTHTHTHTPILVQCVINTRRCHARHRFCRRSHRGAACVDIDADNNGWPTMNDEPDDEDDIDDDQNDDDDDDVGELCGY